MPSMRLALRNVTFLSRIAFFSIAPSSITESSIIIEFSTLAPAFIITPLEIIEFLTCPLTMQPSAINELLTQAFIFILGGA